MALIQKTINTGVVANDGTGDPLRTAFRTVNENFTNLYTEVSALPTTGLTSRETISKTTSVISQGGTVDIDIDAHKGYVLYQIQTDAACWVRIYSNSASRQADSGRTIEEDPFSAAGVITEIVTDEPKTILFTPGLYGFNVENPPSINMPIKITNLAAESRAITLNITLLKTEV
jgi:hypothetical protein